MEMETEWFLPSKPNPCLLVPKMKDFGKFGRTGQGKEPGEQPEVSFVLLNSCHDLEQRQDKLCLGLVAALQLGLFWPLQKCGQ